ncbi:hypothetical protein [Caproiciproducens sp. MSJ-32]|uniref:hypothetical protein n=1 Tax=Caproiciproducens sp. MSJ-32 TaxID=2841527 RepID=UPI001C108E8F|nr:hypothetical protein [Caproiciproducens sp. MSJ-32]MBU5454127.1 hypothetical protein [Caproiciproducens sp. MSJ-32]
MILRNKKGKELIIANDEEFIYYKMSEIDKINLRENNNKIYCNIVPSGLKIEMRIKERK